MSCKFASISMGANIKMLYQSHVGKDSENLLSIQHPSTKLNNGWVFIWAKTQKKKEKRKNKDLNIAYS